MKIQYCSDLHLEFEENNRYVIKNKLVPQGELLLLAGDILPFQLDHRTYAFFDEVAANFEAVYWVPGNHEYYGGDMTIIADPLYKEIRENVFLINNHTLHYKGINIIASTLWSHISPNKELILQRGLADFYAIRRQGGPFLPVHFNELHQASLQFIKKEVTRLIGSPKIVVSHHVPTLKHYPPKYKNSRLQEGFAIELHNYIETSDINYWVYGHHHFNTPAFDIGKTKLLTNQLGYVRKHEHRSYVNNAVIEINGSG